jgi:hypothetical protein
VAVEDRAASTVGNMQPTVTAPTTQLLAWIDEEPRGYAETLERWKTSCPRLAVWEDALADGLVCVDGRSVLVTGAGRSVLAAPARPPE